MVDSLQNIRAQATSAFRSDIFTRETMRGAYVGELAAAGIYNAPFVSISEGIVNTIKSIAAGMGINLPTSITQFLASGISSALNYGAYGGLQLYGNRLADYLPFTQPSVLGASLYRSMPFARMFGPQTAAEFGSAVYAQSTRLVNELGANFPGMRPSTAISTLSYMTELGRGVQWDPVAGTLGISGTAMANLPGFTSAYYNLRRLYGEAAPADVLAKFHNIMGSYFSGADTARLTTQIASAQAISGIRPEIFTTAIEAASQDAAARNIPRLVGTMATAYGMGIGGALMTAIGRSPYPDDLNVRIVSQQLMRGYTSFGGQLIGGLMTATLAEGGAKLGPAIEGMAPSEVARKLGSPELASTLRSIEAGTYAGRLDFNEFTRMLGTIGVSSSAAAQYFSLSQINQQRVAQYAHPATILNMQRGELQQLFASLAAGTAETLGIRLSPQQQAEAAKTAAGGVNMYDPEDVRRFRTELTRIGGAGFAERYMTSVLQTMQNFGMWEQFTITRAREKSLEVFNAMDPEVRAKTAIINEMITASGREKPLFAQIFAGDAKTITDRIKNIYDVLVRQGTLTPEERTAVDKFVTKAKQEQVDIFSMPNDIRNIIKKYNIDYDKGMNKFTVKRVEVNEAHTGKQLMREEEHIRNS